MERKLKRQQRTVGSIVKIPLENGFWTYARVLEVKMAFYDAKTDKDLEISEIIEKPILFFASVYDSAITKGFWEKIGKKLPLETHLTVEKPFYKRDALTGKYQIIFQNKIISATKSDCEGLERWLIWTHDSMEQRIIDHYKGVKNQVLEVFNYGFDD